MVALPSPSFGSLLRRYRLAAGLTQEVLAERAGLSPRAVIALERGERRRPYRHTIEALASALHLSGPDRELLLRTVGYLPAAPSHEHRAATLAVAPLVGRSHELAVLERHLESTEPPLLLLAGEPGIGKSRLLLEAAKLGRTMSRVVLEGGCQRRSAQEAYAPIVQALADLVATLPRQQVHPAFQGCSWLVHLLPELTEFDRNLWPAVVADTGQARRLMFSAVTRFLANVAGPTGSVLLLDDLQWAGADALDLLETLVRDATHPEVRVVAAYRDTEVTADHPLQELLTDLGKEGRVRHLYVGPLAPEAARTLLDRLLDVSSDSQEVLRDRIVQRAGGVPFFLVSCAQAARSGEELDDVPWTISQSVRQRAAQCSPEARTILRIVAVAGRAMARSVLLDAVGQPDILAALDEARDAGLLEETEPRTYGFTHDVIRDVMEAALGPEERTRLHAQVGRALEPGARPEQAAELAWHFREADDRDRALKYSLIAGVHAAERFAHDEAEGHFYRAVELARDAEIESQSRALLEHGTALRSLGRYEEALKQFTEAARIFHTIDNADAEGSVTALIGLTLGDLGRPREGIARIYGLLDTALFENESRALPALYVALASLHWFNGQYDEQLHAAERAAELASHQDDQRTRLRADVRRGHALRSLGRYAEAREVLAAAIPSIEQTGDFELLAPALDSLSIVHLASGEFHEEGLHLRRGLAAARRFGDPSLVAFMTCKLGQNAYYVGEWERAHRYLDQAIDTVRSLGAVLVAPYALGALGGLCGAEGEWELAETYLREAIDIGEHAGFQALENAVAFLASLDIERGRPDVACSRLQKFVERYSREQDWLGPIWVLAWSHVELENYQAAADLVTRGLRLAHARNDRLAFVHLLWVSATMATRQSCWPAAESALDEVLPITRAMPYPLHEARALELYGRSKTFQGDDTSARRRLMEALTMYRRLGARPGAARTGQALRELYNM